MTFASFEFVFFVAVFLCVYHALPHRGQNVFLLAASYLFYGWWDWRFCSLLALSTLVDFFVARQIAQTEDDKRRKRLVTISVVTNLGILCFFKYANFFVDSFVRLTDQLGLNVPRYALGIVLPVGISFYTFQTMSYTIEVYRRRQTPSNNLLSFAIFVSYFPQLVAGPIERAKRLLPQIDAPRTVTSARIADGLQLILLGYVKKVAIADAVAPYVDRAFSNPSAMSSLNLVLGAYLFTLQVYGDFSGYTDIARGTSRLLGIELTRNFRQPYLSASITEFWRRWHVTLSDWLRDYLYIPLGGNRKGPVRTYVHLFMTMLLGGLWHGAGWNYVIWGGMHGVYLAIHRLMLRGRQVGLGKPPTTSRESVIVAFKIFVTFTLHTLSLVVFRSGSLSVCRDYLAGIASNLSWPAADFVLVTFFYGVALLLMDLRCWENDDESPIRSDLSPWLRGLIYALLFLLLSFVGERQAQYFIYFQF